MLSQISKGPLAMPSFERLTVVLALVASIMVAVVPPALHFHFGMRYAEGRIEAEAKANARTLSRMVGRNPQMWSFEVLRINELISFDEVDEFKVVLNAEGDVVTGLGQQDLARPIVQIAYPIFDSGVVAGQVVIRKSLYGLAKITFLIFLLSSVVAAGAFIALKLLPLKLLRKAVEHAAFLASHDPLTELPNRSLFNEWLTHSVADVERQRDTLAVLCLDLDHFKEVNDILGHAAGDELLRQATDRMKASLRRSDILARMGGDEFAIIQKHASQPNGASELAERLLTELTKPFDLNGNEVLIGASIGIALHDDPEDTDGQALLRQADLALYRSKHEGRGTFRYFVDEMNDKLLERKRVERELRQAISRNELELHYQPQIDLGANKIKGVEALLRWNHPTQGLISPETFIPLAEECGLIVPIGDWVIREACRQAKDWPELSFAVNVSPIQFRQGNLVATVKTALQQEGVEPHRLEIEITEGVLLSHTEATISTLKELQGMGIRIAMDDFGTGYSSLSYLRRFPFDKIKIDKSFTSDLGDCHDADSIIKAVIKLGASMGMKSNAEGVETVEQANLLREQGCDEVQGFYFSHPMPSGSIGELLADWEWNKVNGPGGLDGQNGQDAKTAV